MFLLVADFLLAAVVFPLPIADVGTVRYQTTPWVTVSLIVINTLLLFFWMGYADALVTQDGFAYIEHVMIYGYREIYFQGYSVGAFNSITAIFMHIGHMHLIGNMIMLWAFGKRLEDACGPWRFLIFYLIVGIIAGFGIVYLLPPSDGPGLGASGAVFGIMGAYLILFPTSRIKCLWLPGIFPIRPIIMFFAYMTGENDYKRWRWLITLPSILVLGLYIVYNLLEAQSALSGNFVSNAGGKIVHMVGFLGSILIFLFVRKDLLRRYIKGRNL